MFAEFEFDYQPKYPNLIKTDFDLLIQCEVKMTSEDEPEVNFRILNQNDFSEVDIKDLDLRDQALINDQSYTESDKVYPEAYQKYIEAREDNYNKEYFYE